MTTVLRQMSEDTTLPNPVHVDDMILRKKLTPNKSLELNRLFVEYQKFLGETQKLGKEIRGGWQGEQRYLPARKSISSSREKPASLNKDIRVPFGKSRLCRATTARRREVGW